MVFGITAAGLSGFGQAAGGLASIASAFGLGQNDGPSFQTQLNDNLTATRKITRAQNYHALEARIEAAKANGLHPLTAVGGGTTAGSMQAVYKDKGPDLDKLGQGIDRALNAGRNATQRKLDELALEKAGLENDYLRTQIAGSQAAISGTAGTVAIRSNSDDTGNVELVPHKQTSKHADDSGRAAGLPPAFVRYDVGNGQTIELPYSEEGPSEALENMPIGLDYLKAAELYGKRYFKKTPGYWLAKQSRKLRKKHWKK